MENNTILKLSGLTKKFDSRTAVDHISLEIREGEIFGLLGPNGAGKSTTLNMVCSLLKPTSGSIEVFGMDAKKHMKQIKRRIGYIPQDLAIHGNLRAWENVELFTSLYGIRGRELREAVDESLEFVGLLDRRNSYAKTFSGGMKRRLNIACSIGHKPDLMIYYMEEVEAICARIAIMDNGRIIATGTRDELARLVTDQDPSSVTLEEVFLTLTGKKLRDYAGGEG